MLAPRRVRISRRDRVTASPDDTTADTYTGRAENPRPLGYRAEGKSQYHVTATSAVGLLVQVITSLRRYVNRSSVPDRTIRPTERTVSDQGKTHFRLLFPQLVVRRSGEQRSSSSSPRKKGKKRSRRRSSTNMASSWLLLVVVAFVQLVVFARSGNVVPVLIWSGDADDGLINPLHKTSRSEFEQVLVERVAKNQAPVMVFVKENFCVEEIKHHKQSLQQMNKAGSLSYFASVESALAAFESLPSYNVSVEDDFESVAEGQLVEVPINDINAIPDVYGVVRESSPNIVIALTGKSCSYSSSERIKRAVDPKDAKPDKAAKAEKDALIISTEGKILLYADVFPVLKIGKESHQLETLKEAKVLKFEKNRTEVQMSFTSKTIGDVDVIANFNTSRGYVKLVDIICTVGGNKTILKNRVGVEYPTGNYSYHCGTDLPYTYMDAEKQITQLVFNGLQVQLNTTVFSGDVYDCVGFTTVPIWMGLFVTFLLGLILMWGIIMIMDIRTMDRFDDPKGKTITVTAQE